MGGDPVPLPQLSDRRVLCSRFPVLRASPRSTFGSLGDRAAQGTDVLGVPIIHGREFIQMNKQVKTSVGADSGRRGQLGVAVSWDSSSSASCSKPFAILPSRSPKEAQIRCSSQTRGGG